jgi:hypothetical protein
MRLIFFSFRANYRKMMFNNFLCNKVYGKYVVINLGGPFKHYIAKFLIFLGIGRGISCDGDPLISKISKGINFWSRNSLHIPEEEKKLNNCFTAIRNNHIVQNDIFQLYPIKSLKSELTTNPKIIFISRIDINTTPEEKKIWDKNKEQLLKNFDLIDDVNYWSQNILNSKDEMKKYTLYVKLKLLLRFEIVKSLKNRFGDQMQIIGNDWKEFSFQSLPSPAIGSKEYNVKDIYNIYKGNICLDLGSLVGSISLYHRSIQIIEAGGLIIQSKQHDSKKLWGDLYGKLIFNNINDATNLIERLLNDQDFSSSLTNKIYNKFNKSEDLIEKSLDRVFNRITF